jgi:hypothetical protein
MAFHASLFMAQCSAAIRANPYDIPGLLLNRGTGALIFGRMLHRQRFNLNRSFNCLAVN